ncbi:MAG: Panacea domain-containing protein [Salinispira sp.]
MNIDTVVNVILQLANKKKLIVRPMKLQKLLWFAHGWYTVWNKDSELKGLISHSFEAWPYGPVVSSVYHEFKHFRSNPIDDFMYRNNDEYYTSTNAQVKYVCGEVIRVYGEMTDIYLSGLTHNLNGAWWKAFSKGMGSVIDQSDIFEEFSEKSSG